MRSIYTIAGIIVGLISAFFVMYSVIIPDVEQYQLIRALYGTRGAIMAFMAAILGATAIFVPPDISEISPKANMICIIIFGAILVVVFIVGSNAMKTTDRRILNVTKIGNVYN